MLSFEDIKAQDKLKNYLKNSIKNLHLSHAYMISGENGMGKMSIAKAFSLLLFCETSKDRACLSCHTCRQTLAGNNPDIIYIHTDTKSIGVAEIREKLCDNAGIKPYKSKYKLYIVDEAHKLTTEAQNALLKTIEEPAEYVIILLLSENEDSFLETIKSRCIKLKPDFLTDKEIESYLINKKGISKEHAQELSAYARGNLGKALELVEDEQALKVYKENISILRGIKWAGAEETLEYINKIKERDGGIESFLSFVKLWYRDILVIKTVNKFNCTVFKAEYKSLLDLAKAYKYDEINNILDLIDKTSLRIKTNVNTDLTLSLLFNGLK